MAEYTWVNATGAHWKIIEAEYNAEWASLAYLDGPGYTVWDRMEAKSNLHRKYFSRSSSHGVVNSTRDTLTQSVESHFTFPMAESKQQGKVGMTDYAREIQKSCARILKLLQEEIDATESTDNALPTSDETFTSMEPIIASDSVDVAELTNDAVPISEDLPSIEPNDEQSAEDSVGLRTSMVELVTPIVRMPLLNEITDTFPKGITRFADTPNLEIPLFNLSSCKGVVIPFFGTLINSTSSNFDPPLLPPPKPPDQNFPKIIVELSVICNLMMPPPPPKPPHAIHEDVDITVLLSCVDGNRYDNSILELVFVPFHALTLSVKCSVSFAHQVAIYVFQAWNAHHVFDVMPKMVMVYSNSLNVGFIIAGVLDEKELLSSEFVSRYCVVGVIQFIYEVYDQLRWITCYGYVYYMLISKNRSLIPCLKLVLSPSVLNSEFSPNARHYSSWLYELNPQRTSCEDYGLNDVYGFCNIKGASSCKCLNAFEPMFSHEWKMLEWFDGDVTQNWHVCRDGDMFNHFTRRNLPIVDFILKYIQVVVYGYSVLLFKLLISEHIHAQWQQKSQERHLQFGVIVDHDEFEKATLFNSGLASKTLIIFIDLEDKIMVRGVGNDMINVVLIPCLFSNILCNEKTICDIKVVEIEMMERIRHKKMFLSSWNDALEFHRVQIMDPLEVISMEPLEVDRLISQIFFTHYQDYCIVGKGRWWQIKAKNMLTQGIIAYDGDINYGEVRKHVVGVTCHDFFNMFVMCEIRSRGLIDPTINLCKILVVIDEKPHTNNLYGNVSFYMSFCFDPRHLNPLNQEIMEYEVCDSLPTL